MHQLGMPGHQQALASYFPHYFEIALSLFSKDDETKRIIGRPRIHSL